MGVGILYCERIFVSDYAAVAVEWREDSNHDILVDQTFSHFLESVLIYPLFFISTNSRIKHMEFINSNLDLLELRNLKNFLQVFNLRFLI